MLTGSITVLLRRVPKSPAKRLAERNTVRRPPVQHENGGQDPGVPMVSLSQQCEVQPAVQGRRGAECLDQGLLLEPYSRSEVSRI
jgi:hypothetical protein